MNEYTAILIGSVGIIFSGLQWYLARIKMRKELFTEFNIRYMEMNDKLQEIHYKYKGKQEIEIVDLSKEYEEKIIEYFNLCAEEYYWKKRVRFSPLDKKIWLSWTNGMKYYFKLPIIQKLWERELNVNGFESYYLKKGNKLFYKL
jgi:hypothetical protein